MDQINPDHVFWSVNQNNSISLNNFRFKRFLEMNNFFKNKPNADSTFNIIQKTDIFLQIKDEVDIKDFVLKFIKENKLGESVFNLMTGQTKFFQRNYLDMIETEEIKVLRDISNIAYLFYQNGVVEINKETAILKKYKDYNINIWKDQVIERNFIKSDHHESEYRTFIWLVSGGFKLSGTPTINEQTKYASAVERYNTFQTVIGYLLHSYNSSGENKAIILNDEAISDDPNGRSGKGIFWNAIKHLKKVQSLNGKSFNFDDPFPYQGVKTDCQILVWDDVKKNFDFEKLFSVITEGIEITYKGKNTIKLPIEDSPKILITTNYTIKGKGYSHEDRRFEVELSNFFNGKYTPIHYFGHKLFDSWDDKEWARFDCYMIECLKKYLTTGLVTYTAINLPIKKLEAEMTKDLYEHILTLPKNEWISSHECYDGYLSSIVKKQFARSKKQVTLDIKKYCEFFALEYDNATSNGIMRFIMIEKGLNKPNEFLPF